MLGKPLYFLFTILMGLGFLGATYTSIIDIIVFQRGIIVKGLITNVSTTCTKTNWVTIDYNNFEYSLIIGYVTCRDNQYVVGDSTQIRIISGQIRAQSPNEDPRIIAVITIVVVSSIFFYFLFNYKSLTTSQSEPEE